MSRGIRISVSSNRDFYKKTMDRLQGVSKAIPSVISNALNRAADQGRTDATRKATELYTAKAGDIRRSLKVTRAKKNNLTASIDASGKRLPLEVFAHRPSSGDTTGTKRKRIRVSVRKDTGFKNLDNAFIWNGKIYQRNGSRYIAADGKRKEGITHRVSVAIPQMLNNEDVVDSITNTMQRSFEKRLDYETKKVLDKVTK